MEPKEMLLLFARHGIEHPPTKQLEDRLRRQCLGTGDEATAANELIARVEGERAKYEAYLSDLKKTEESLAVIVRERTEAIVGGLTWENADPAEVMRRWGFIGPLNETPLPASSRNAPNPNPADADILSIRKKKKAQQKAERRAAKRAAKISEAKREEVFESIPEETVNADSAMVTVAVSPPHMEIVASPRVHKRVSVDPEEEGNDDVPEQVEERVPPADEGDAEAEEEGALQHRGKRKRTQDGESSRPSGAASTGVHVLGEDQFTAEDTVLDLETAARLGKYMLLPGDLKSFEGHDIDEIQSYITAHALAVRILLHLVSFCKYSHVLVLLTLLFFP
jgi:hypothetical protein